MPTWIARALTLAEDYERAGFDSAADAVRQTLRLYVTRGESDS